MLYIARKTMLFFLYISKFHSFFPSRSIFEIFEKRFDSGVHCSKTLFWYVTWLYIFFKFKNSKKSYNIFNTGDPKLWIWIIREIYDYEYVLNSAGQGLSNAHRSKIFEKKKIAGP